jgi:hypothetical protein
MKFKKCLSFYSRIYEGTRVDMKPNFCASSGQNVPLIEQIRHQRKKSLFT